MVDSNPLCYSKHLYLDNEEITSLIIPDGMTKIGNATFGDCYSLKEVTIPNSVTSIGNGAFQYCSGLTTLTIGSSVTYIDLSAFSECLSIASVTSLNPTPPAISISTFETVTEQNATLHVPEGCKDVYESSLYWKNFYNIQSDMPNGIEDILTDKQGGDNAVYTIDGVRCNTTKLSDLPSGVYIVKGKKIYINGSK